MHLQNSYSVKGGTLKIEAEIENNLITMMKIEGDLGSDPADFATFLEKHLKGVLFKRESITNAITTLYLLGAKTEKVTKEELIEAIMGLSEVQG